MRYASCILFVGLFIGAAASLAHARSAFSDENPFPGVPAIVVSGESSDTRLPDRAAIRVTAEGAGASAEDAMRALSPRVSGILDAVRRSGIPDERTQSGGPTVDADFEVTRDEKGHEIVQKRRIVGYKASYDLRIGTENFDAIPDLIERMTAAGGLVQGVTFSIADQDAVVRRLEERAAADGMDRARQLIKAVGAVPGRVLSVSAPETGVGNIPQRAPPPGTWKKPITIRPGLITNSVSMNVRVEMLQK